MKNWRIGLVSAGLGLAMVFQAMGGLIISQYYEGASNNKWIEIYNPDASAVDLAAGGYRLGLWSNIGNREGWKTNSTPTSSAALTNVLASGATLLIKYTGAVLPAYAVADLTNSVANFNGDDSLVLYTGSTYAFANVVDAFGMTGSNALDRSFVRTNTVTSGVNTDFNAADWIEFSNTAVDGAAAGTNERLGYHSTGAAPVVTNVRFMASSAIVDENAGTYAVTIYKNHAEGDVSGSVFLLGSASNGIGADYTLDTTNFTLNGTTTSAVVNITINDDTEVEGAETIILSLFGVTGATTTSPDVFTLTVNPSDQATYAIGIIPPTNGTVTTTPASNATAGAAVTITATPDTGYTVDAISVVGADSNAVTVTGTTFTMPAQAVTVTVTFKVFVGSSVFISEVADPSDNSNARFVELYNAGGGSIDLAAGQWYLARQANGTTWANIALTGTVDAAQTYVVAYSATSYPAAYPSAPAPNQVNGSITGNGDDGYFLYSGGNQAAGTLEDAYGVLNEDGSGKTWDYEDKRAVRQTVVTNGNPTWTASEWTIASAAVADMTPGVHPDGPPPVTTNVLFTASAAAVAENTGTYAVTVIKSRAEGDVSGTVALSGTATEGAGADYTVDTTNFTLNGTTTSAVFTVTINNDTNEEAAETIMLTLANVAGGTISAPSVFTLTINANDTVIAPEGLAAFRFQEIPYLQVSTKDADLTVTDMALTTAQAIETAIETGTYFPNEPYIEETGGWTNAAQAGAKAFVFTVTPTSGKTLTIDGIFFRAYASGAGPSAFGYDIGGGLATYAVDAPDSTLLVVSQAVAGVTGQTGPVEIRIQGWLNGSRTTTGGGIFKLDDVVIYGTLSGGTPAAPSIEPITFVAGTGFRFPVPSNYTLNAVYGADAELTAGGEWTWSALNAPGDYSEAGGVVTITTTNAVRRMIRIGVLAAP